MKTSLHWLFALIFLVIGCAKEETNTPSAPGDPETPAADGTETPQPTGSETPSPSGTETPPPSGTQTPPPETTASVSAEGGLDVTYITENFTMALVLHPSRALNSPLVKALIDAGAPIEQGLSEITNDLGIDPRNIEQVLVLMDKETAQMAPMFFGVPGMGPGPGFDDGPFDEEVPPVDRPEVDRPEEEAPTDNAGLPAASSDLRLVNAVLQDEAVTSEGFDEAQFPEFEAPPVPTVIVRFVQPVNADDLFANAPIPVEDDVIDGLAVKRVPGAVAHFVDQKTLIVTSEKLLKQVVSAKNIDSPLTRRLKAADPGHDLILVANLKPFKQELMMASGMLMTTLGNQPEIAAIAPIPSQLEAISIGFGPSGRNLLELNLLLDSDENASTAGAQVTKLLEQGRPMYEQSKGQFAEQLQFENPQANEQVMEVVDGIVSGTAATADGPSLKLAIPQPRDLAGLVGLLEPEVRKAAEQSQRSAAMAGKKNNLKQIGLGFHNYHDVYGAFPGAGSDAAGMNKGLSWRVHLLPMLDEFELYNEFHLDEPWDSDHNKTLIARMPDVYQTPGTDEGKTSLHVFLGEQAFSLDKGLKIFEITDGTSNTFLVVQAGADKADVWTKPGGLKGDADDPHGELGTIDGDSFLVLFGDGSVRAIPLDIAIETLKALITRNGGEVVDFNSF